MAKSKAHAYHHLSDEDKAAIRDRITPATPPAPPARSRRSLEEEHYSHQVLLEKAEADGDEDAAADARTAMATIEEAIATAPDEPDTPAAPATPAP